MSQSSEDISQQFINGGVVPGELVGQQSVSKKYVDDQLKIRDTNISNAMNTAGSAQASVNNHVNSITAHPAQNITYNGDVKDATNVKEGLDNLNVRVSNIVADAGNSNTEIVDARQPATGTAFSTLKQRLDEGDDSLSDLENIVNGETTAGKTIYVDIVNGNNSFSGNQEAPYKNINFALSKLKKNIATPVKIRVLPGDYTSEGQIAVINFKTNTVTITAFDGTNDVDTINDNYKIKKMGIYNCDWVIISGFRIMNTDNDYGLYAQRSGFIKCIGIKNIESTPTSDGFGATFGTTMHIIGCQCANKGTVVSSNNGSKVISEGWDPGSTANITTIKAQWGGQIHKIGTQPSGTNDNQHINAGTIFEEKGDLFVSRSFNVFLTKEAALTGTTTLAINLPNLPKWIKIDSALSGSASMCVGSWSSNSGVASQSSIARSNVNAMFGSYSIVHLTDDGTNTVQYEVSEVTESLITLNITKTGNPVGTIFLSILCGC